MMGDRVRLKQDSGGQWWLGYTRYHKLYWRETGTTDEKEAYEMAVEIEATLVAEQRRKMDKRPDWKPEGLEPTPVQVDNVNLKPESAAPFNPARLVKK
jgi:hypothetical protein